MALQIKIPQNKLSKNSNKTYNWVGYTDYYNYFFVDYLNYKFSKDICAFKENNLHFNGDFIEIPNGLNNININIESKIRTTFINNILNCKNKFTMIPIRLSGHQHILLYDTEKKELELFEPYGSINFFNLNPLTKPVYIKYIKKIKQLFDSFLPKYKFFEPIHFFPPGKGFQQLEIERCNEQDYTISSFGFCVVWSFWYIELRIQNKNISRNQLVKNVLSKFEKNINKFSNNKSQKKSMNQPEICKVIRDYSKFLIKLDSDKSFLQKKLLFVQTNKVDFFNRFKIFVLVSLTTGLYGSIFSYLLLKQ